MTVMMARGAPEPRTNLYALTVWQPWLWLLCRRLPGQARAIKPVENRTWRPPARLIGQRLALHAGMHWCARDCRDELRTAMLEHGLELDIGAEVAAMHFRRGMIAAVGTLEAVVTDDDRSELAQEIHDCGYYNGPVGWVLCDVVTLPDPIVCKGAQGLWRVPDWAASQIDEQLRGAVAAPA